MTFTKGQEVKIRTGKGVVKGVISDELDLQGVKYWWVQLSLHNRHEVTIYGEKDLVEWNRSEKECDCGSKKLGSDRHMHYCSTLEK